MEIAQFDRDITLAELIRGISRQKLAKALDQSLQVGWRLCDTEGKVLLESSIAIDDLTKCAKLRLRIELEDIGFLLTNAPRDKIENISIWMGLVLSSAHRYSMAADIHLESVSNSYKDLQTEHAALQESEQRYRDLSAQLENRVSEQVLLIERSQRQLYQAEKMASVGSLAAGVAHEINNPIGFLRSNLSTAIGSVAKMRTILNAFHAGDTMLAFETWEKYDLSFVMEDFDDLLRESVEGADRVARIVANLKDYSNVDHAVEGECDLNESVNSVMRIIGDQPHEGIDLRIELQALPQILCDRGRMNQVLLSLVQNAVRALSGKGSVCVSSCVVGSEIKIAVKDNGCGMDEATLSRIFDPFFTMQDVGKGTGLGLTVSQEIVASYGGRLEVESKVGVGSTFTVIMPVNHA